MIPTKQTAPKARQRSGANVSSSQPSTAEKMRHVAQPVNVLVGEIVKRDDGTVRVMASVAGRECPVSVDADGESRIDDASLASLVQYDEYRLRQRIRELATCGDENFRPFEVLRERVETSKGGRPGKMFVLTEGEALFVISQINTKIARAMTHHVIRVFVAVRKGLISSAPAPAPQLPPEVVTLLAGYRRELEEARNDIAAHKQENAALMKLIGVSGKHRADQLKRILNEAAMLNSASQGRSYRSCRTEVENLVRDRVGYPRGAAMRLDDMPSSTWEQAKVYANQELARARRLHSISAQLKLGTG